MRVRYLMADYRIVFLQRMWEATEPSMRKRVLRQTVNFNIEIIDGSSDWNRTSLIYDRVGREMRR